MDRIKRIHIRIWHIIFLVALVTILGVGLFIVTSNSYSGLSSINLEHTYMNTDEMLSSSIVAISDITEVTYDDGELIVVLKNAKYYLYEPYELKKSIPEFEISINDELHMRFYEEGSKKVVTVNNSAIRELKAYFLQKRD